MTTQLAGGLDEVFVRKTGAAKDYLLTDALGSTWGLADSSGNVTTQYKYDVFGTTQASGATSKNPLQYTGRENDGTGLYYYRNRYYSPKLRRFISRDPLGEAAGENEYSYVSNNPTNFTDPLGLQEGPVNYLRNPFSPDNWIGNGLSNTVSDLLWLDSFAEWSWTLGNWCRPLSERLWAGVKMVGAGVLLIAGGAILGKALGWAGKAAAPLLKRIPTGPLSRLWSKAKWSRNPKSLMDEMVLNAAKKGKGEKIIDNLNDARFKGMEKWSYGETSANGWRSEVHYVRDPITGNLMDFKFKVHSIDLRKEVMQNIFDPVIKGSRY